MLFTVRQPFCLEQHSQYGKKESRQYVDLEKWKSVEAKNWAT